MYREHESILTEICSYFHGAPTKHGYVAYRIICLCEIEYLKNMKTE